MGRRGRRKGTKNGEGKIKLAPIVKWSPMHEQIVHLHALNMPNDMIAEKFGITPGRVSQVLNDPTAKKLVSLLQASMRSKMEEDLTNGLVILAETSFKRISETLNYEDFAIGSDGKKHQDNLALSVLKGTGFLNGEQERDKRGEDKPLSTPLAERLIKALEKSNQVAEIQANEPDKIIDADFEVVESKKTGTNG